jgi:ribonuclease VapC
VSLAVADASLIIALMLGEPRATEIEAIIAECVVTTVNLAEVVGYFARNGALESDIRSMLDGLRLNLVPFDADLAYVAGLLLPMTRRAGLSLGDRACLALARRLGVRAVTTDRAWLRVAEAVGVGVDVVR